MYPNPEEKDLERASPETSEKHLPLVFGESNISGEISRNYSEAIKNLQTASMHRMLLHPKAAREQLANANQIISESGVLDVNLEFALSIENSTIHLYEGDSEKAWSEVNTCMYLTRHGYKIDPYLISTMHAIEAVCLQDKGLKVYADQALSNSETYLKYAKYSDAAYQEYLPYILLCHARCIVPDRTGYDYIKMLKEAKDAVYDLSKDKVSQKQLYLTCFNTMLSIEYLSSRDLDMAQKHIDLANNSSVDNDSNLNFTILITKSKIHFANDEMQFASREFTKATSVLNQLEEVSLGQLSEFFRGVFDIYYLQNDFQAVVESIEMAQEKLRNLHTKSFKFSPLELSIYARSLWECGDIRKALECYSQASEMYVKEGTADPELFYKIHKDAFKCAFMLGDKPALLEHSEKLIKQAKEFPAQPDARSNLIFAFSSAALAAYFYSQTEQSLSYVRMALGALPEDGSCIEYEADLLNLRAGIAADVGIYDVAIEDLNKVLQIKDTLEAGRTESYSGVLSNLADVYLRSKKYTECFLTIEKLADLIDANPELSIFKKEVFAYRGLILLHTSDNTKAAEEKLSWAKAGYYELNRPNDLQIAEINKWFGDLHYINNDRANAFLAYQEAERVYDFNGTVSIDRQLVNQRLSSLFLDRNDLDSAIRHQEILRNLGNVIDRVKEKYFVRMEDAST